MGGKHSRQMAQWRKWYIVELTVLGAQIEIEYVYIECFDEKLKRLTEAHNKVFECLSVWSLEQLRGFVAETIVTVTKMKVSSVAISKKRALESVKKQIGTLQREY